jgi:hypothetical protein
MKTHFSATFFLCCTGILILSQGLGQGIKNSGGYIRGSTGSYLCFNGSGNAYFEDSDTAGTILGNVVVDFTSTAYKLIVKDNSFLTCENLLLGDSLFLKASSGSMASLITTNSVQGSPVALVEQYVKGNQWHLVGSPLSNGRAKVYTGMYLRSFSETTNSWSWITAPNTLLVVGKGYSVWSASNVTAQFKGFLNTGDKSPAVTYTAPPTGSGGWNLLGNPFPSTLEWNSNWTKSKIDATVYVFDGTQYLTWNYNLGGYGTMGNGRLPSTQGFWVKANASSPSITIPNSERLHTSQQFYKDAELLSNVLKLKVTGKNYSDEVLIHFNAYGTEGFDSEYDAFKLAGIPEAPQLYSIIPSAILAVNVLPPILDNVVVPLGFVPGMAKDYTMQALELSSFDPNVSIYLEDLFLKKMINLKLNPYYSFSLSAEVAPERFLLHFSPAKDLLGDIVIAEPYVNIYSYEKSIYIKFFNFEVVSGEVQVINVQGQLVYAGQLENASLNRINLEQKSGYYFVKIKNNTYLCTEKVLIW